MVTRVRGLGGRSIEGIAAIITPAPAPGPIGSPPVNTVPGAQTAVESTPKIFSVANGNAITVADSDSSPLITTISTNQGTLSANVFAGATIQNNGTGIVTISGTPTAINGSLNGLIFNPTPEYFGAAVITIQTNDGSNIDQDTINITITQTGAPPPPPPPPPLPPAGDLQITGGTNLSGMEWGYPTLRMGQLFPNQGYTVPRTPAVTYLDSRGFTKNRLPIRWEMIQPVRIGINASASVLAACGVLSIGDLHPQYVAMIDYVLDAHAAAGTKCIIDMHNYCRYKDFIYGPFGPADPGTPSNGVRGLVAHSASVPGTHAYTNYRIPAGQPNAGAAPVFEAIMSLNANPSITQAQFKDVWAGIAITFKDHPGFGGYGLMNEPHDMPSGTDATPWNPASGTVENKSIWPTYAQAAINEIRLIDPTNPIYVSGNSWSSVMTIGSDNPAFPLSGTNLIYEGHMYLDASSSGLRFDWDAEVARGFSNGEPGKASIDENTGLSRISGTNAVPWLKARNLNAAITEIGMPVIRRASTQELDTRWIESFRRTMDYATTERIEVYTWAGGEHWPQHAYPTNHIAQWHQNRSMESIVSGVVKAESNRKPGTHDQGLRSRRFESRNNNYRFLE